MSERSTIEKPIPLRVILKALELKYEGRVLGVPVYSDPLAPPGTFAIVNSRRLATPAEED